MQTENNYAETDLGNIAPNPMGDYNSAAEYEYLDLVTMQGGSYLCLAELGQTITGTAPEPGKTTELWQCLAMPGDRTPEYTDAYDKVVRLAKEVAQDAAKVAEDKQSVTQMETNARQLKEQAEESARQAENSKDSAAGSARGAKKAEESARQAESNVRILVNGFDTHVSKKTTEATQAVATAKDNAVQAVGRQETASVQGVKDQTGVYITEQKELAKQELDNKVSQFGLNVNAIKAEVTKEGQKQITNVQEATTEELAKIAEKGTEQTGFVSEEGKKQVQAAQAAAQEIAEDREQIRKNTKGLKTPYTDAFFKNYFAMQRTGKKYTVRFPLWETSQISTGEKLDDNKDLVIEASTLTEKGRNDYEYIPLFRTYDCNVEKIEGKLQITAMKGDLEYNPEEKDTFVLGMPYYTKTWIKDGYLYISRSDTQHNGYVLCPEARKKDGARSFCLYAKYIAGKNKNGTLGSYAGVAPERGKFSYNTCITEGKKRGAEYCFGSSYDIAYIQNTFLIKYADKNWNNKLGGNFATHENQFLVSKTETGTKRVILTKANAEKFPVGSAVSVGDLKEDTNKDRANAKIHNICDNAKVIDVIEIDEHNKALVLDIPGTITTTATTWVTAMHWRSGFSEEILGRDGCPCKLKTQITSVVYPSVIQGIECMVGGYEVLGNAYMDIVDGLHRDVYVCSDVTKLETDVATAKRNYTKITEQITVDKNNEYRYGTEIKIDCQNGINVITKAGASGSGSSTGFCDGIYFDNAESGQRELLCFGNLWRWFACGCFCLHGDNGLGNAWWGILARLSLNVYRGEFA